MFWHLQHQRSYCISHHLSMLIDTRFLLLFLYHKLMKLNANCTCIHDAALDDCILWWVLCKKHEYISRVSIMSIVSYFHLSVYFPPIRNVTLIFLSQPVLNVWVLCKPCKYHSNWVMFPISIQSYCFYFPIHSISPNNWNLTPIFFLPPICTWCNCVI